MREQIILAFKPCTSKNWAHEMILQVLLLDCHIEFKDICIEFRNVKLGRKYLFAAVSVPEEDKIKCSRAIRMIPEVIDIARKRA